MGFKPGANVTLRVTAVVAAASVSRSSLQISTKARILLHFVPRFGREKDGGGEQGHYSCLSVHLASAGQLLRQKEKPSLVFFHSPLFSAFLFPFFFYFGGRLAGLSMAHICSSSLLVFTTALGLLPPKLMEWRKDGAGGSQDQEILQAYFWLKAVIRSLVWAPKHK